MSLAPAEAAKSTRSVTCEDRSATRLGVEWAKLEGAKGFDPGSSPGREFAPGSSMGRATLS
jgi:hypothetical protein